MSINLLLIYSERHVDAGKSTLIGHLLYNKGDVSQKEIHKYEKKSHEIGQSYNFD